MKRLVWLFLTLTLVLSCALVSCRKNGGGEGPAGEETDSATATDATTGQELPWDEL